MRIQRPMILCSFGVRTWVAAAALVAATGGSVAAQPTPAANTVTISLAEYNRLLERAAAPPVPTPAPPAGAVVSQADLALRVDGDLLRGTITLQGEVLRDAPTAVPLLGGGALLRARVAGGAAASAGVPILQQQGVPHAVLSRGPFTLQIDWAAAIVAEPGRASAQLPTLSAGTIRATIDAPGEGSDLTIDRALVTRRTPGQGRLVVEATLSPGAGSRLGWSSRDGGPAAPVRALRLLDDVKTLITVAENDLRMTALFDVTVVQGTTTSLTVRLPDGFAVTSVTGAPNEGHDVAGGRLVLSVPAGRTRYQFLIALERANADGGGRRSVPLPWLEGSQRETGDVGIEGVGALELGLAEQRPLTRIDVAEVSPALAALAREPLLAAWRYQRRGADAVSLAFDVTRFPDAAVLAAAADRATATTLVTPEGRSLTEIALTVRNQAQPFLKVGLPQGAELLSAEVSGVAVKPAQGSDGLRIPLMRPGFRPQGPYQVSFVYLLKDGTPFAGKGDASLSLARVDLPVAWLDWEVLLPDQVRASKFDGNAIPAALVSMPAPAGGPIAGAADSIVATRSADREAANEPMLQMQSQNAVNLQKRAEGVLPVRMDVPRSGLSYAFVRPMVLDEETRIGFSYKMRR